MRGGDVPDDVERFLFEELETYEELEALLHLFARPAQSRTVEEIAAALGAPEDASRDALDCLRRRNLVTVEGSGSELRFAFRGAGAERDLTIGALARLYAEKRLAVMRRMNANAIERLRTKAIRTFSDAFLLKRKRDDG
jgi:hypothetical protein